ncbi:hypothetical protein FD963_06195 [Polynucleobacter sp. JS-JIR-II-50]|nr:hypothetical protein FD963_06195 [Polynucleobacter sp. JS-JIR-II-50]
MTFIKNLIAMGLLLLALTAQAEKLASQNWVVDLNGQTNEAYTANDSKSSFGVFCSGEKCLFYLHQALKCDPGTKYSVLMNSQSISTALSMECTQIGGNLFQILDPFDAVLKATQTGEMIGFAVALQSGAFAVTRFSLVGAKPAIERALLEAAKSKFRDQKPPPENTPKSTLKDISI